MLTAMRLSSIPSRWFLRSTIITRAVVDPPQVRNLSHPRRCTHPSHFNKGKYKGVGSRTAACIIIGMCTGLQWNFLIWHVEILAEQGEHTCDAHDHRVKTLQGLITAVQRFVGEVPFMYLSGWVIDRLGHVHCITLVLAMFGLRFLLYSFISNPWWILYVEVLQGFKIFYATMTSFANKVSPKGTSATVQGMFGSTFEGLGVAAGSLIGSLMFYNYGGAQAFFIFGIGAYVFSFLHCVVTFALRNANSYRGVQLGMGEPESQEMHQITASATDVDTE